MTGSFGSFATMMKIMAYFFVPKLMSKLKVSLFSEDTTKFFQDAISETMKIREEQGIIRPDLINLLMQAKKGKLSHEIEKDSDKAVDGFATVEESQVGRTTVTTEWHDDDLVAQSFIFFFAGMNFESRNKSFTKKLFSKHKNNEKIETGFESVSTMISFIAYELMVSPDCQTKLQAEIDEINKKIAGKPVSYNQIQGMKYMDQVVCETLRKWPSPVIDRLAIHKYFKNKNVWFEWNIFRACNKDFELEYDGKKILIEKGRSFYISTAGLHYDERYFENPDKFDPERFNEENRGKIDPGTYLPFGELEIKSTQCNLKTKILTMKHFQQESDPETALDLDSL